MPFGCPSQLRAFWGSERTGREQSLVASARLEQEARLIEETKEFERGDMVVIEAAAITAAAAASYHGGKKAICESAKKIKRGKSFKEKKKERDDVIASRQEQRRERMADVNKYRDSFKSSISSSGRSEGVTLPQFNILKGVTITICYVGFSMTS